MPLTTENVQKLPPLIEYRNVTLLRNNRRALNGITLSIDAGEHVAILGPNGAGKSSFIKTITRELATPIDGEDSYLRILGKELWNITDLRTMLGIVGSEAVKSRFADFTCRDIVVSGFFGSAGIWPNHHVTALMQKKAAEVMKLMGVFHLSESGIEEISSGESRLVMMARALINNPLTMLLDEPTASLDLQAARRLRSTLSKVANKGTGIIMITHNLTDIIPAIRRVVMIRGGKVILDGDKDIVLTKESLSELFDIKVELRKRHGYYYCW